MTAAAATKRPNAKDGCAGGCVMDFLGMTLTSESEPPTETVDFQ
jgi:hypothetical protein